MPLYAPELSVHTTFGQKVKLSILEPGEAWRSNLHTCWIRTLLVFELLTRDWKQACMLIWPLAHNLMSYSAIRF